MAKPIYVNLSDVNELQTKIMQYISLWVHTEKTTVPLKEVIKEMSKQGTKDFTTIKALQSLIKKGYIRRDVTISNTTRFVQLRSI